MPGLDNLRNLASDDTDLPVVSICRNPTALILPPNQKHFPRCPASIRGAFRDRHERWVRDAVDALATQDGRRSKRTAKSCGPGIPTLMSSLRGDDLAGDGGKKARSPGRVRRKPLKPLRAGTPGDPAKPAVTTLVCFFVLHARPRAQLAPGVPHALPFSGRRILSSTRTHRAARRELVSDGDA